jgi:hypothetical protein
VGVQQFAKRLRQADAFILSSPEYHAMPGSKVGRKWGEHRQEWAGMACYRRQPPPGAWVWGSG